MFSPHFGLSKQPFNITPDPEFFYTYRVHEKAYTNLLYGIRGRKGCIALIGEAGTGKTTLLRRAIGELESTAHVVFFHHTTSTFDELLDSICHDLGLSVPAGRRLEKLKALNEFLVARHKEDKTVVLIIDEAQNLTKDVLENLRLLSNFETSNQKLLQIVLAGPPGLENMLEQPELRQLKQRIMCYCRLYRLNIDAVGPFISHRLRVAGCLQKGLFTERAIWLVAKYSDGIPRLINALCDNALFIASNTGQQTIGEEIIEEAAKNLALKKVRELHLLMGDIELEKAPFVEANGSSRFRSWSQRFVWVGVGLLTAVLIAQTMGGQKKVGYTLIPPDSSSPQTSAAPAAEDLAQETAEPTPDSSSPQTAAAPAAEDPAQETAEPTPDSSSPQTAAAPAAETARPFSPSQPTNARENREWPGQSITVARGDTISRIVLKAYGSYNVLALDLIKEFNPDLEDLNLIIIGTQVWLPDLTRGTLLRKQEDDSYHLVIGSFHSEAEARKIALRARRRGYVATISQRKIARMQTLYRVELAHLQNPAAADRAWNEVVKGKT
jgi:general secretion pathway protein A